MEVELQTVRGSVEAQTMEGGLSVQTVVMMLVRYAISEPEELAFFVDDPSQEPLAAVEAHLVDVAARLLLRHKDAR